MSSLDGPIVRCERMRRVYDTGVVALDDCDLTIDAGDYVSIMGPSGSGKSTLLNCLGLVDRPDGGSYRLAGVETTTLAPRRRAAVRGRLIGFVFQSYHLLQGRDLIDNIAAGLLYHRIPRRERIRRAVKVAEGLGLEHRLDSPVETLSGGERQRVAIGRAIIGSPALVLADEPTGNLDSGSTEVILDLLGRLNARGHTIVLVTHDTDVARRARRRFTLVDGRVTEEVT